MISDNRLDEAAFHLACRLDVLCVLLDLDVEAISTIDGRVRDVERKYGIDLRDAIDDERRRREQRRTVSGAA